VLEPVPVVIPVVLWLLMDALVVVAPLFTVEPGPGESVGEGSWVLAERVMPVPAPVLLGLGEFCILGRIHSGPNCILEDDMSGRWRLEGGLDVDWFGVGGGKFEFAGLEGFDKLDRGSAWI
jgi:hypothetical protein